MGLHIQQRQNAIARIEILQGDCLVSNAGKINKAVVKKITFHYFVFRTKYFVFIITTLQDEKKLVKGDEFRDAYY